MASGPCLNPSCKSHGKPHLNCECYSGGEKYAEGGSVCDHKIAHESGCEYFRDGGPINNQEDFGAAMHITGVGKSHVGKSPQKHSKNTSSGHKKIEAHIEELFKSGYGKKPEHDQSDRDKLDASVADGSLAMPPDGDLGDIDPNQAAMVGMSRGRASRYLGNLRPRPELTPRLAFDEPMEDHNKNRIYESALHVANDPSSVLAHIKAGTLEPEHLQHLAGLHPEAGALYQKRATERVSLAQMQGEAPDAHVRAGLGQLLGAPLSGEMTPQAIQAAQAVFAAPVPQQAQGQAGGGRKPSGSKSALSKTDKAYLTPNQAREKREQKA